ncbi:methyltransferase family protein [Micromonospora olivasterospora]|uniref:Methyltransferase family protein n=1 Tax=Micromonospora olivasterospora TaxID=1880 RepID=A0A562I3R2_MICOL|nr:methyltransferase family protein [Micromonospora olivasterospora]
MTRLDGVEQTRGRLAGPPLTPRTAVIWSVLRAELERRADDELTVLDVGGGTGGFAVPLARAGHRVTVVDASPDALAALTRRAAEAGVADRVRALQGDGDALAGLVGPASADLVLCHSVLEVVDDPRRWWRPWPPRCARAARRAFWSPGRPPPCSAGR